MTNSKNQEGFKPSKIKIFAIALTVIVIIMNIIDLINKGGPNEEIDYIAIGLMIACILLCIFIIRNEKKRKEEYEVQEKARLEKKARRRNNKKK